MYHQVIKIGEGHMPVAVEYGIDDDCGVLWIKSIKAEGIDLTGYFLESQLSPMELQLWKRHDSVVAELDSMFREDRAAERAEFRDVYA